MDSKLKTRKTKFTDEFKQQMVYLYNNGRDKKDLQREYNISRSALGRWIQEANAGLSFHAKDNLTPQEKELIELRKENIQLKMENDILKQATLIMGQKSR